MGDFIVVINGEEYPTFRKKIPLLALTDLTASKFDLFYVTEIQYADTDIPKGAMAVFVDNVRLDRDGLQFTQFFALGYLSKESFSLLKKDSDVMGCVEVVETRNKSTDVSSKIFTTFTQQSLKKFNVKQKMNKAFGA